MILEFQSVEDLSSYVKETKQAQPYLCTSAFNIGSMICSVQFVETIPKSDLRNQIYWH